MCDEDKVSEGTIRDHGDIIAMEGSVGNVTLFHTHTLAILSQTHILYLM